MNQRAKRMALSALTTFAAAVSLTVGTTTQASAIDVVPCGRSDFLTIYIHVTNNDEFRRCFANAGEVDYTGGSLWLRMIETGNNRVQWYGDGRWQPAEPIGKWTRFTFPNHPGGVRFDGIKIY